MLTSTEPAPDLVIFYDGSNEVEFQLKRSNDGRGDDESPVAFSDGFLEFVYSAVDTAVGLAPSRATGAAVHEPGPGPPLDAPEIAMRTMRAIGGGSIWRRESHRASARRRCSSGNPHRRPHLGGCLRRSNRRIRGGKQTYGGSAAWLLRPAPAFPTRSSTSPVRSTGSNDRSCPTRPIPTPRSTIGGRGAREARGGTPRRRRMSREDRPPLPRDRSASGIATYATAAASAAPATRATSHRTIQLPAGLPALADDVDQDDTEHAPSSGLQRIREWSNPVTPGTMITAPAPVTASSSAPSARVGRLARPGRTIAVMIDVDPGADDVDVGADRGDGPTLSRPAKAWRKSRPGLWSRPRWSVWRRARQVHGSTPAVASAGSVSMRPGTSRTRFGSTERWTGQPVVCRFGRVRLHLRRAARATVVGSVPRDVRPLGDDGHDGPVGALPSRGRDHVGPGAPAFTGTAALVAGAICLGLPANVIAVRSYQFSLGVSAFLCLGLLALLTSGRGRQRAPG